MNRKQKLVLWVAILVIVLMVIIPPVSSGVVHEDGIGPNLISRTYYIKGPYGFLFADHLILDFVKYDVLLIQCAVVVIVAAGLIYTLKDKKPKDEQRQ